MTVITAIEPGIEGPLASLLDTVGRTSDAMVAIGPDLHVIAWNEAATELLGYSPGDALGASCVDILGWSDRCGNTVCDGMCPAVEPGDEDEVMGTREVIGRSAAGKTLWLSASTIVPPVEMRDQCRLVHLIREVSLPPELERLIIDRLDGNAPEAVDRVDHLAELTPREREVMLLLTEGRDGAAIAKELYVSPATVRNHIQHILAKLGVHSRVEAVAFALRGK